MAQTKIFCLPGVDQVRGFYKILCHSYSNFILINENIQHQKKCKYMDLQVNYKTENGNQSTLKINGGVFNL